jgi:hypothetical protein
MSSEQRWDGDVPHPTFAFDRDHRFRNLYYCTSSYS